MHRICTACFVFDCTDTSTKKKPRQINYCSHISVLTYRLIMGKLSRENFFASAAAVVQPDFASVIILRKPDGERSMRACKRRFSYPTSPIMRGKPTDKPSYAAGQFGIFLSSKVRFFGKTGSSANSISSLVHHRNSRMPSRAWAFCVSGVMLGDASATWKKHSCWVTGWSICTKSVTCSHKRFRRGRVNPNSSEASRLAASSNVSPFSNPPPGGAQKVSPFTPACRSSNILPSPSRRMSRDARRWAGSFTQLFYRAVRINWPMSTRLRRLPATPPARYTFCLLNPILC